VVGKIYNIFPLKQYLLIIADSIPYNCELYTYVYHLSTLLFYCWGVFYKNRGFYLEGV
ncbi:uncharacterized protein METZ01_LOCUS230834, partial [marine metagenome]